MIVGLMLLFMVVTEYLGRKREIGRSYVTPACATASRSRKPK